MKKEKLILITTGLLLIIGIVFFMNSWEERVLIKNLKKAKDPQNLSLFLEKILPQEATGKIKIQEKEGKNILATTFKLKKGRDPNKVIKEYLIWAKKGIEINKIEIDSIRIFVYFNKEEKQYYAIVGKKHFNKINNNLSKLNDCERGNPLDIENFCIKSKNF